jgi:hypothetical protein
VPGITSLFTRDSLSRPDTTLRSPEEDSLGLLPFQLYTGDMPDVNIFLVSLSERRVFYSRKNYTCILTQFKEVGPREAFLLLCIYEHRPGNVGRHRPQFLSQFCMDGGRRSTPEISGSSSPPALKQEGRSIVRDRNFLITPLSSTERGGPLSEIGRSSSPPCPLPRGVVLCPSLDVPHEVLYSSSSLFSSF